MSALTVAPLARMDTEETEEDTPSLTCSSESQEGQDATVLLGWLSQAPCLSRSQPGPGLGSGCLVQSTLGCTPEPQTALLDTLRGHTQHSWPPPSAKAQGPASLHTQAPRPPRPPLLTSEPTLPRSLIWQQIPHGLVVGPQLFIFSISIKLPPRLMSYLLLDYKNSCHHSQGMEYRTRSKDC